MSQPAPAERLELPGLAADPPRGTERVLVVDDMPSLRELTQRLLIRLGYAADATDGVGAVEDRPGPPPDLLLVDVVMPEVGGSAVVDRLRRDHPGVRVLFMSGHTRDEVFGRWVGDPGVDFIGKPFTLAELGWKVREVLDRPARG